jgi:hypothetical protein
MKQNCPFPETVEHKSCTATIYQQIHREAERFAVRYYDVDGSIQRLTFPTYSSAKKFAETAVKEIAANREHFVTPRGRAAFEFQTALETLTPLGLTIFQAAKARLYPPTSSSNHSQAGRTVTPFGATFCAMATSVVVSVSNKQLDVGLAARISLRGSISRRQTSVVFSSAQTWIYTVCPSRFLAMKSTSLPLGVFPYATWWRRRSSSIRTAVSRAWPVLALPLRSKTGINPESTG